MVPAAATFEYPHRYISRVNKYNLSRVAPFRSVHVSCHRKSDRKDQKSVQTGMLSANFHGSQHWPEFEALSSERQWFRKGTMTTHLRTVAHYTQRFYAAKKGYLTPRPHLYSRIREYCTLLESSYRRSTNSTFGLSVPAFNKSVQGNLAISSNPVISLYHRPSSPDAAYWDKLTELASVYPCWVAPMSKTVFCTMGHSWP